MSARSERVALGTIAAIVAIYLYTVYRYASFMPIQDDYSAALGFLELYQKTDGWLEKLKLFFIPNADHRIVVPMVVEWMTYKLSGHLDFRLLIFIGNLGWLATFALIARHMMQTRRFDASEMIPFAVLFFSFAPASLMTWSLGSLQQYWQLFFALLSIAALVRERRWIAYGSMIAAIATGGGGFALVPVFGLYDLVYRRWRYLAITVLIALGIVYVYFIALPYRFGVHDFSGLTWSDRIRWCAGYFFTFLGGVAGVLWAAVTVGAATFFYAAFRMPRMIKEDPFLGWSVVFVAFIAVLTTQARCTNGIEQALASRYTIYGIVWLVLLYGYARQTHRHSRVLFWTATVAASIVYAYHAYDKLPKFEHRRSVAETKLDFFLTPFAEERLRVAYRQGYFTEWKEKVVLPSEAVTFPVVTTAMHCSVRMGDGVHDDKVTDATVSVIAKLPLRIHLSGQCRADGQADWDGLAVWIDTYRQLYVLRREGDVLNFDADVPLPPLAFGEHRLRLGLIDRTHRRIEAFASIPIRASALSTLRRLPVLEGETLGRIDTAKIDNDGMSVAGWAAMKRKASKGYLPVVRLGDRFYTARYGQKRVDVARALHRREALFSGYAVQIPKRSLPETFDSVRVYLLSSDHRRLFFVGEKPIVR